MAKPKFDYDGNDFYDEILALAMQGLTDTEISYALEDRFGKHITPELFFCMKNGNYSKWTPEQNKERSERIVKVLARGRYKVTSIVRGRYLKAALGGIKTKSNSVVTRKLKIDGEYTEDEEIQTTAGEVELPPNMQALATWLYHHDEDWRKVERKQDDSASDIPTEPQKGISIDSWIKQELTTQTSESSND